jgi:hypothetical protein
MAENNNGEFTRIEASHESQLLLPARPRRGCLVYNNSWQVLFILMADGPAHDPDRVSVAIMPFQSWGPEGLSYDGELHGVWRVNENPDNPDGGFAHITELPNRGDR